MLTQLFTLSPDQETQVQARIELMEQESLNVSSYENGPFCLVIVKDGTEEAESRKNSSEPLILGLVASKSGEQYLIAMK
ncbi:MAG: hypothetical protein ACOYMZ_01135 [Minisyncoccia bacterium]